MPGRTVAVTLSLQAQGFAAGLAKAQAQTAKFATDLAQNVDRNSEHISKLSTTAGLLGAGLAVGLGAAVKSFADFDSQMSAVAATGADARTNLEALRQAAIQAGADTAFSATEAAEGIESLAKAGVSAQDTLGGGLKGALDLAAAGGITVAEAADTAATALTQFKLAGQDVPHVADLLAAGSSKAQGEVSDLAQALKQSGLVANQFGLNLDTTVGTLSAFAHAGLIGSDAGTSFKTMLLALASPSKQAADTMQKYGIATKDAAGNFIGITGLAEQLKTKLGGVSQAQRNAALATIFGTDAIRAASILYEEGADGIQGWIDNVNDSGYAAQTAATRLDNLKGDIEAFKGSLETALIGSAADANGLRDLIQTATGVVNAYNKLPPAVKDAGLAVVGSAAGALLAAAGIGKLAVVVRDARAAFVAMGISAKAATLSIPGIGILLAVASIAVGKFASAQAKAEQAAADFDAAISGMTGTINAQTVALNENVRATAAKQLQDRGADAQAKLLGLTLRTLTDASLGNQQAINQVHDTILTALRSGTAEQIQAAQALGRSVVVVGEAATTATKKANDLRDATKDSAGAATEAHSAFGDAEHTLQGMASEANDATTSLKDLAESLFTAGDAAISLSDSQVAYRRAIDSATEAAKKNAHTLDTTKKAGQDNTEALNRLATQAQGYIRTLAEQGKGTQAIGKATADARKEFINVAVAMGLSGKRAGELADKYGLIARDVTTTFETPGAVAAKKQADDVKAAIKDLPKDTRTYIWSVFKRDGIDAALAALRAIQDKEVKTYITTIRRQVDQQRDGAKVGDRFKSFAYGGKILGEGSDRSDNHLAAVSPGEWWIQAPSARHYGDPIMSAINQQRIPREVLAPYAFADGGRVPDRVPSYAAVPSYYTGPTPIAPVPQATSPVEVKQYFPVGADPMAAAQAAGGRVVSVLSARGV